MSDGICKFQPQPFLFFSIPIFFVVDVVHKLMLFHKLDQLFLFLGRQYKFVRRHDNALGTWARLRTKRFKLNNNCFSWGQLRHHKHSRNGLPGLFTRRGCKSEAIRTQTVVLGGDCVNTNTAEIICGFNSEAITNTNCGCWGR